jgi:DNA-directed RNA polymerase specialized sigma24 family protein
MDLRGDAGAAQGSRAAGPLITPPFETVWPDVERRLRALLFRRGLDQPSVDDVVQEVALRALAHHVTYASANDLIRWAAPVACNLHVDLLRQRARVADDPGAADRPASDDVAGEVAHRIELQRAFRGIAKLRPADREAIIDAVAAEPVVPGSRKEAVRLAVRRHRARSRLALVLEQLAAWLTGARLLHRSRRAVAMGALLPAAALPLVVGLRTLPHEAAAGTGAAPATAAPMQRQAVRAAYAVPRVAAQVAVPVPQVTPAPDRPAIYAPARVPGERPRPTVTVDGPGGVEATAGKESHPPGVNIVCVNDVPTVPWDVCL